MLLTIKTTHHPATDLGYLLHKHPDKLQSVDLSIGAAHIYYPESTEEQSTVALLLDIDPIDMVRGGHNKRRKSFALGQYVNDRPYVASSFMSVAIAKAFSTAMNGVCKNKPDLVDTAMPFEVHISVLPAPKGGALLIRKLFEPLGYEVQLERHILDETFSHWGDSKYYTLTLKHTLALQHLLTHLYVLIPVLDNDKHYYVNEGEINKLLTKGKDWLATHPEKEQITRRYLLNLGSLSRQALTQLNEPTSTEIETTQDAATIKKRTTLHQKRLQLVLEQVKATGAISVLDLGCGEGKLLKLLLKDKQFQKITGTDISFSELSKAKERLYWEDMSPKQKERITLFQGALTYQDARLTGYDAAALVEVIEHLDEDRLPSFERVVFECAQPKYVVITTPNKEYNVLFERMEAEKKRHDDHRFEWTRKEFEDWAKGVADRNGYQVSFLPIGEVAEKVGAPSQMGVFTLNKS